MARPDKTSDGDALGSTRYRPLNRRRRMLVLLLAVATGVTIVLTLLSPPGGVQRVRKLPQPCAPGQTEHCVGGKAEVIVPPASASASR
jgi:hypothetical protein